MCRARAGAVGAALTKTTSASAATEATIGAGGPPSANPTPAGEAADGSKDAQPDVMQMLVLNKLDLLGATPSPACELFPSSQQWRIPQMPQAPAPDSLPT